MTAVRAVFFDLDDTLLDGAYNDRAVHDTCLALAAGDSALDASRLVSANRAIWPEFWTEFGEDWELGKVSDDTGWTGSVAPNARALWRRRPIACAVRARNARAPVT